MEHRWSARFLWVFLFLVFGGTSVVLAQAGPSRDERKLLRLLNQEREKAGLSELRWDSHLAASAGAHALLLAEHQRLSHHFPEEPGLGERISATGLRFTISAENVASAPTVEVAHQALMNSPGHRANILNPGYNAVGLAVIPRFGVVYVAQNFAYVLPVYSETEFRDAVIAAFQSARQANGLAPLKVRPNPRLHEAACSESLNTHKLIRKLDGVTGLVEFNASDPEKLPSNMQRSASDAVLRRVSIEVCFKPGPVQGYASFQVVAAFSPIP